MVLTEKLLLPRPSFYGQPGNAPKKLLQAIGIGIGEFRELNPNSESRAAVHDLAGGPQLSFIDPDTYFYLRTFFQGDLHLYKTSSHTEVGRSAPDGSGLIFWMNFD